MKKLVIIAVALTFTACSASGGELRQISQTTFSSEEVVSVLVDYPHYESFEALAEKADIIVSGSVSDIKINETNEQTIYMVEITKAYKGEEKQNVIITQFGFSAENKSYSPFVVIDDDKSYVFFAAYTGTSYQILSPYQAVYELSENSLKNVGSGFSVTLEELEAYSNH